MIPLSSNRSAQAYRIAEPGRGVQYTVLALCVGCKLDYSPFLVSTANDIDDSLLQRLGNEAMNDTRCTFLPGICRIVNLTRTFIG